MINLPTLLLFLVPTTYLVVRSIRKSVGQERASVAVREAAVRDRMTEPPSLHPVIDPLACIGCGACVDACPEQSVLGLIEGKAELVAPAKCIGHGACKAACPTDSIALVFGTETRGVDIPALSPTFETNVPGIFIAGELGGMGLIRNAIEQGRQAVDSIRSLDGIGDPDMLDLVIVGAGPAGFSASLAAMQHQLRVVTVEQDTLGGAVAHYPRGKLVMTAPVKLPVVGKVRMTETTKEELLSFWQDVEKKTEVKINYKERMESVAPSGTGFVVRTSRDTYRCRAVLLTIGRRGTPRKLGVPGEELDKVYYRLVDPDQFRNRRVVVVGGGDSALEAATAIASQGDADVSLVYRGPAFSRAKEQNRSRVRQQADEGRIRLLMEARVEAILPANIRVNERGETHEIPNDCVIVCAGGVLPTPFLRELGVRVETKHGAG